MEKVSKILKGLLVGIAGGYLIPALMALQANPLNWEPAIKGFGVFIVICSVASFLSENK